MQPNLVIVDSLQGIKDLKSYLEDKDFVAFDTETTGLLATSTIIGFSIAAEESKAFYIILHKWDVSANQLMPVLGPCKEVIDLIKYLTTKKLICHNAIFDCMMVENNFKVKLISNIHTDTMILAHLLDENRRVGLKELAKQYFGADSTKESEEMKASVLANGGKLTKACYEMFKADSQLMAKYGAQDALLTYKLFLRLVPELFEQGLDKFFYEEESMPLLKGPTYELNTTGLKVDQRELLTLKKQLEAECEEAKAFIYSEIAPYVKERYPSTSKKDTFSITSCQQLSWLMFGELELEFSYLTKKGKEVCRHLGLKLPYTASAKRDFIYRCLQQTGSPFELAMGKKKSTKIKEPWAYIVADKATLEKHAKKYKWIQVLLEYKKKMKLLTTYVRGIENRMQYGIIRPSFLQHGTTSGRYASRDPNFQNLPRDDKRIKTCIVARPGRVLVGADYSQLEPRVFAYFSKDERLKKAFEGEDDFYSIIGVETFEKGTECIPSRTEGPTAFRTRYPNLRQDSKTIALASTYGATGFQLAPLLKKSADDAQDIINSYFEKFPGVRNMMLESHDLAKTNGQVTSLFGRPRRMPEAKKIRAIYGNAPTSELPYQVRSLLNLAVNHRIQSTAASIVNRAAITYTRRRDELGIQAPIIAQVHDSLVVECLEADAEKVVDILRISMETTTQLEGIGLEAIPKIGKNLSKV